MIRINPRIRDDLVVEIIIPAKIDLRSSQIDMKVGLFARVIMADEIISIISISHFLFLVYKTIVFWDVGSFLFVGFCCGFVLLFFFQLLLSGCFYFSGGYGPFSSFGGFFF